MLGRAAATKVSAGETSRVQPLPVSPFSWSVYEWLPGESANGTIGDLDQAAADPAAFVSTLRQVDTAGAFPRPPHRRGGPLAESDEQVRRSIAQLGGRIDGTAPLGSWQESLNAPAWDGADVWVHGDLLPETCSSRRAACRRSSTSAASTWTTPPVTCSLHGTFFAGHSRARFRAELKLDDASWLRGRGWALSQAVTALPYYWDTNPGMIRQATHALAQVLFE